MLYKQEPPFAAQVELTEGCNLRCSFCGVNGIRGVERTYKYMTGKTARRIAEALKVWNCRIEFAMHGEPTMHPAAPGIVQIFRDALPKANLMMLSNGGGLVKDPVTRILDLFGAGLNTLGLDEYEGINLVPKIMEAVNEEEEMLYNIGIHEYPTDPMGNPHQRKTWDRLVHIKPISLNESGTHATLNNHAGSGAPKNASGVGKRCAKPFREISFRWDGGVAICCNSWTGKTKFGNINTDSLDEIWNGPVAQAARKKLYHGMRDFGPCDGCDAVSYRVGLLPDKMGKVELPKPSKRDIEILAEADRAPLMTKQVKREWDY